MIRTLIVVGGWLAALIASAATPDPMQTARSYFAEAEYASAAKSFEELLKIFPADPVVMNNLAVSKAANGEYQAALELLNRAVKIAPYRTDIQDNLHHLLDWTRNSDASTNAGTEPAAAVLPEPPPLWPDDSRRVINVRAR
jgi:tetratricopeptide (TPR) repeat protein